MKMEKILRKIQKLRNPKKAECLKKFFKTGKGEYGEGDIFWGITVPEIRKVCQKYILTLDEIQELLKNKVHEVRFAGLVCLRNLYETARSKHREMKSYYDFYFKNLKYINNWDLVDTSAPYIVGDYLLRNKKERKILYKLVKSKNVWERRISVLATFSLIKKGDPEDLEKISILLLNDKNDLIQKAVGWMLRESGKINEKFLIQFLDKNHPKMPRTMLRYSIERLGVKKKKHYLQKVL